MCLMALPINVLSYLRATEDSLFRRNVSPLVFRFKTPAVGEAKANSAFSCFLKIKCKSCLSLLFCRFQPLYLPRLETMFHQQNLLQLLLDIPEVCIYHCHHFSGSTQIHNLYYWDLKRYEVLGGKIQKKNKTHFTIIHICCKQNFKVGSLLKRKSCK